MGFFHNYNRQFGAASFFGGTQPKIQKAQVGAVRGMAKLARVSKYPFGASIGGMILGGYQIQSLR